MPEIVLSPEDAADLAAAQEAYDEYVRDGCRSRPIQELWKELGLEEDPKYGTVPVIVSPEQAVASRSIGKSWAEVRKEIFTPEEIAASDERVAEISRKVAKLP